MTGNATLLAMSNERLNELECRLRKALADELKSATARHPAWRKFEASLDPWTAQDDKPQDGTSASSSDGPTVGDTGL